MKVIASLIVGCVLATTAFAADSPSPGRMKAATELLNVMGAQRASEAGIQATLDNLISSQPKMAPFRSVFMAWAAKYVSWQELGPRIAALYASSFTTPQLEDLIHFYETPTGRKAAQVMPDLAKQAMLIGASVAREHTPELQQMIRARAAQLKQATPQGASQSPAPQ